VQFEIGEKLSYLGMQIEIRDDGTIVDMSFYKKYFHSTTAKLLYLAKRARTGILTIIFFVYEGTVCKGTGQRKAREGIGVSQVVRGSSTTTLGMCGRRNCGVCRCSICDV
jgi:hypothetical protein